jgi:hypothetical protein
MKSNLRVKFLAGVLAAVVLAAVCGAAFASSSDPELNFYDTDLDSPVLNFVVENEDTDVFFFISPSLVAPDAPPTYFSSEESAQATIDSLAFFLDTPPSLTGAEVIYSEVVEIEAGQWVAQVFISLPADTSFGSLSVRAVNAAASPETVANVSIVRQPAEPVTSAAGVGSRIYHPENEDVYSADQMTVDWNDYHELTPDRDFPTVTDGTIHTLISSDVTSNVVSFVHYPSTAVGQESYLWSMTISTTAGTTTYPASGDVGWEYRVYRDPDYKMVSLSEFVGTDSMMLQSGDIILWKYIDFNSSDLFPASIDLP